MLDIKMITSLPFGVICIVVQLLALSEAFMRCPTHVKQFGAYPYRNITGRSYYYQCNGNQQADLKKCEEGEEYDPESEQCVSSVRPERIKRNAGSNHNPGNNLKQFIRQPTLGRAVTLGALFYGVEDRVQLDENLWAPKSLQNAKIYKTEHSDFKVATADNTIDRANVLNIGGSLTLSFMGGLLDVHGSAKYLTDRKKSLRTVN